MRTMRSVKYAVVDRRLGMYHKVGWLFTKCGLDIIDGGVELYKVRPKGLKLCGNCARSKK